MLVVTHYGLRVGQLISEKSKVHSLLRGLHSHLVPVYSAELGGEPVVARDIEYGPTQSIQVLVILGVTSYDLCNTCNFP